jgi:hypothetical protein
MINFSNRLRGLALLLVTFAAGGVGGVAADRAWLRTRGEARVEVRPPGRRTGAEPVESDRIPYPLEVLQLSPQEEARLHEIARRWRPQAARAMESIRANISDLENNMFAEMLCVISKDKQERYLAQLQENGADRVLIDKRFALVRSDRCGEVRR